MSANLDISSEKAFQAFFVQQRLIALSELQPEGVLSRICGSQLPKFLRVIT